MTGKVYTSNYAAPTPMNLTTATGDMMIAYTAAGRTTPDFTDVPVPAKANMGMTVLKFK